MPVGMRLAKSPREALWRQMWERIRLWLRGNRYTERRRNEVAPADALRMDTAWSVSLAFFLIDRTGTEHTLPGSTIPLVQRGKVVL